MKPSQITEEVLIGMSRSDLVALHKQLASARATFSYEAEKLEGWTDIREIAVAEELVAKIITSRMSF